MRNCTREAWTLFLGLTVGIPMGTLIATTPLSASTMTPEARDPAPSLENDRPARPTPKPLELTIATLNIKWYGNGGTLGGSGADEKRDPFLKDFISKQLGKADAIVFQEIVDLERLQKNVLSAKYKCQSYENNSPKHQKVAICWNKKYKFNVSEGEPDFIWEDVMIGRLRPAVVGTLSTSAGKPLLQIIGVHLKAMPGFSSVRQQQARLIANHLIAQPKKIPTLITGDFNTFDEDASLIQAELDEVGDAFAEINFPAEYTFRSGDMAAKFDRFFVSAAVEPVTVPSVWKACNYDSVDRSGENQDPFEDIAYYNEKISDHCPVQVTVRLTEN